jgi:excinuclease ABC subunit A
MSVKTIQIRGARTHNLKNIDLTLPRDKLIVFTGLSGSGKSSLAFDTIYAEGQRRYVESLSAYARQFLSMMDKPDVDHIEGLSPAISIEQKTTSHNPRSTVGTVTEIYDYLRLLFARVGVPHCPNHPDIILQAQTVSQMVDIVLAEPEGSKKMLLAPVIRGRKGEHIKLMESLMAQGFLRIRVDGEVLELDSYPPIDPKKKHDIEVVVDRFKVRDDMALRLAESFETALRLSDGLAMVVDIDDEDNNHLFSAGFACPSCGFALTELEPRLFSFNNPHGACGNCDGLGMEQQFDPALIITNPALSLAEGAIKGWDKRTTFYYQLIQALGSHYKFDPEMAWEALPSKMQEIVLYGSGNTEIEFEYINGQGQAQKRKHSFEGIINNFARRYKETDSNMVRDELAKYLSQKACSSCGGERLNISARSVLVDNKTLPSITKKSIEEALSYFSSLELSGNSAEIADKILKEIIERLTFLNNVGLSYLNLSRGADSLSGGEAQRIRLASQIGAGLVGVMYVLDEPSIGLHQRDNSKLLETLKHLRDLGNTVIVVEHDEDAIRLADYVVDIGPGAGVHGGHIVAEGTPQEIMDHPESSTGAYLSGRKFIAVPKKRKSIEKQPKIRVIEADGNNLQKVSVTVPLGVMTCVTGVSGSGKSTLINDTLSRAIYQHVYKSQAVPAAHNAIEGIDLVDKIVNIDQSPIGRTPRSNPATYTGLFTLIRDLFANTPEARSRGYTSGRFSFNVKGGRCEACQGDGLIKVEMHFLPDVYVPCDVCQAKRYNRETLDIRYKGKNIHEVLDMTVSDAMEYFSAVPPLARKLQTLMDVGLTYIRLGQNAVTLSGGEAQRVKLAKELSKRDTGQTIYILDEPTTGLHFDDIVLLLKVLAALKERGNTILVIEHNLDVIKTADWIIDLGPEGGSGGGTIVAEGTPETVAACKESYTGQYLKPLLAAQN